MGSRGGEDDNDDANDSGADAITAAAATSLLFVAAAYASAHRSTLVHQRNARVGATNDDETLRVRSRAPAVLRRHAIAAISGI